MHGPVGGICAGRGLRSGVSRAATNRGGTLRLPMAPMQQWLSLRLVQLRQLSGRLFVLYARVRLHVALLIGDGLFQSRRMERPQMPVGDSHVYVWTAQRILPLSQLFRTQLGFLFLQIRTHNLKIHRHREQSSRDQTRHDKTAELPFAKNSNATS